MDELTQMEARESTFLSVLRDYIFRNLLLLLSALSLSAIVIAFYYLSTSANNTLKQSAVKGAQRYLEALGEFRSLYTSEVIKVAKENGLVVTHNYNDLENAIPLPATLSMKLGEKIGAHQAGAKTFLYSPYPFPGRINENQKLFSQRFRQLAWEALKRNPDQAYYSFEVVNERASIRYAIADQMRPACVNCHNNYPETPKNDWQVGDVRGVMEVVLPVDAVLYETQSHLNATFTVMGAMVLLLSLILGTVFSRLRRDARQLQFNNTQLQHKQVELEDKNNRILSANKKLAKTSAELVEASKYKSDFLANMSHEIRTPLNGMLGTAQLLSRTTLNPQQTSWLETINASGKVVLAVLNDILDYSKIDAQKVEINPVEFNLQKAAYDCLCLYASQARDKKLELILHYQPGCPALVLGDDLKIRQIILNLIGNAVKFTKQGYILLEITSDTNSSTQQMIKISCQDSGIGIAEDKQKNLFSSFHQADNSTTRHYGGTGLGLAISKGLVKAMKGEIGLNSREGLGAEFWFSLPLSSTQAVPAVSLMTDQTISVLLIDSLSIRREKLAALLTALTLDLDIANDTNQACLKLKQANQAVDFIICEQDILIPDHNELSQLIMANGGQSVPILLLTDDGETATIVESEDNIYLLHKPFYNDQLVNKIKQILNPKTNKIQQRLPLISDKVTPFASHRILLVEDNPINTMIATFILDNAGLEVDSACNGVEAIKQWQNNHYDLILMDCLMPEMDGYQATREIRRLEAGNEVAIPIVALTANTINNAKAQCLDAGMNGFLSKPIIIEELHAMLAQWLVLALEE